jgi:SAM-dependent methyltransferase
VHLEHYERLQPICPACWLTQRTVSVLRLAQIALRDGNEILEGSLVCPERMCQREHAIIDGIPIILANPASWAEHQFQHIVRRHDLTPFTESLLGDLMGPGSNLDRERGNNGIYAHAHWAAEAPAYLSVFDAARGLLAAPPQGLWIDIGCSVGRGTFELARATGGLSVGVDLNFSMLRLADEIRRTGRARYARRRVGLAFDFVDDELPGLPAGDVSFWCADVTTVPFAAGQFQGALCMNMLDCVPSPLTLLCEVGRITAPGSESILGTPFDWAAGATEASAWLGGHSQRSAHQGSSLAELRRILSPDCQAGIDTGLVIESERDGVKWRLQTNERSATEYDVYLARLRRKPA